MSVPCEVAVKCVLPVIRAMAAQQLMKEHSLKQVQAAQLLKVSQPAISHYCRKIRGKAIDLENDKEVNNLIEDMTESLAKDRLTRKELTQTICRICRTIRAKGLLCKIHKAFEPAISIETCRFCQTADQCPLTPETALRKLISHYATDLLE